MLSIELLESWHISLGHSPTLDEVVLIGVALLGGLPLNWKIRRLLDLRIVIRLRIGDWRITRCGWSAGTFLPAGRSQGCSKDRSQFVGLLLQRANGGSGL